MRFVSSVLVAVFVLAGCDNPGAPSTDLLTVSAANGSLEIRNTFTEKVYYFVADKEKLALLDFAVCNDPTKSFCTFVEPGATRRISYSEFLAEGSSGSEAIVYHWLLIRAPGGSYSYDSIRQLEVDLR